MKTTGYFKEYYIGSKYIGKKDSEKDRENIGYMGKRSHIAQEDIIFKNKKIKNGMEYTTILYPYNAQKHGKS